MSTTTRTQLPAPAEHPAPALIDGWVDAALEAPLAEEIGAHVRQCALCSAAAAQTRALGAALARLDTPPMPAGLTDGILRAVAVERRELAARRRRLPMRYLAMAAITMAAASALILVPMVGVGLRGALLWAGLTLKDGLLLMWDLAPVIKAILLVMQRVYLPLVMISAVAAGAGLLVTGKMMGLRLPQPRGA